MTDPEAGPRMFALAERLYPLCRSITGEGLRDTLGVIGEFLPLRIVEVPSGTKVLDWEVPPEWNIREAHVTAPDGRRVVDFAVSNLHVVGYSAPIDAIVPLGELQAHLHSLPDQPDLVPYRTSYYHQTWGFCLSQQLRDSLQPGDYRVFIDSTLAAGSLTYGEFVVPGRVDQQVLISCHVCHPSLANDNLAATAIAVELARKLSVTRPHFGYRFLFAPGTIGAITWLARNADVVPLIRHGLVLACAGDRGALTYKRSRRGSADIDAAVAHVLHASGRPYSLVDFTPYGYDERQYCSPGYDLPVGCLTRTTYGGYPEYHTSGDNMGLISPDAMADTLAVLVDLVEVLEGNRRYRNLSPFGEPQLGRRGLYETLGGRSDTKQMQMAMLWVLNFSDGEHRLLDIAERAAIPFATIRAAADHLLAAGLLKE